MRLRDDLLILGVAAGLALAVTLVLTSTGRREPVERLARPAQAAEQVGAEPEALELSGLPASDTSGAARTRAAEATDDDIPPIDSEHRREGRRREATFLAEFLALRTEQGGEALAQSVRGVLASRAEPLARKNAGLRALHEAGLPGTDTVLAAAVRGQPDVSDGYSPSLPRSALKLLFERAPADEDARRALARLAFVEEPGVSAELRRRASTSLAASIRGPRREEAVRLLQLETSSAQLAAALDALARDKKFGGTRDE